MNSTSKTLADRPRGGRRNLILLGFVSFFNDLASQMIYPLIPGFLVSLGANNTLIGIIEGIAESTASLTKAFFGWLSDRLRRRKLFVFLGYTLSAITKPFLAVAGHWGVVLGVKFAERTGKGIRTPARDTLISQSVSKKRRGLGFGFQRAMDRLGAAGGPLLAMLVLYLAKNNVRMVFLLSVIPAAVAVFLIFFVREIKALKTAVAELKKAGALSSRFKWFAAVIVIFTLGNSSNAFLFLRAREVGIDQYWMPLLWSIYAIVGSLASPLFGSLSDRINRRWIIFASFFVYAGIYFMFGRFSSPLAIWLLFAGYGIYYGLSSGIFRAFIADLVPADRRATAYGVFETLMGLMLFPASLIFGLLWDKFSAQMAFSVGAGLALVAAALFLPTQIARRKVS